MNSSTPKMLDSFLDFSAAEEEDHPFEICDRSVPDFSREDYPFLFSPGVISTTKSKRFDEEEFMKLIWENDQLVANRTSGKSGREVVEPPPGQLLNHEDEMTSLLASYPTFSPVEGYHVLEPSGSNHPAPVIGSNESRAAANLQHVRALCGSTSAELSLRPSPPRDRKRKNKDVETQDVEVPEVKKQVHGSPLTKRSRAAEVHNSSERRRRDRINAKMKTLRELIPCCNKMDKASLLDDAIEYLKSLQHMVQVMSRGYGMVPMMYPGLEQYIPPMNTIGTNRPIMPYPLQVPISAEHLTPEFPIPSFHLQPVLSSHQPITQVPSHQLQVPIQPQISDFHLYQPYMGAHQAQVAPSQNQGVIQQSNSKPRSISDIQNHFSD